MTAAQRDVPVVAVDQADAVELSELLDVVAGWLAAAGPEVWASYDAHIGVAGQVAELARDMAGLSAMLMSAPVVAR